MKSFLPAFLFAAVLGIHAANAASLDITEMVFGSATEAQVLTVTNDTDLSRTYSIAWAGQAPGKMLHFAPWRVTIAPGESQWIRVLFRKPENLQDGEYNYTLAVTPEAETERFSITAVKKLSEVKQAANDEKQVTIPVIVRNLPPAPEAETAPETAPVAQ